MEILDIDDLIDILPDDEIDALLNDLDAGDFEEDANLIQRGDHSTTDIELSRKAKDRYRNNRETYRKAFDKFQRSSKGRLFYKKLARYNQRPSILNKNESNIMNDYITVAKELAKKIAGMDVSGGGLGSQIAVFVKEYDLYDKGSALDGILKLLNQPQNKKKDVAQFIKYHKLLNDSKIPNLDEMIEKVIAGAKPSSLL